MFICTRDNQEFSKTHAGINSTTATEAAGHGVLLTSTPAGLNLEAEGRSSKLHYELLWPT